MPADKSADNDARQRAKAAEAELAEAEVDDDEEDLEDASERGLTASKGRATPSRRQREEEEATPQGNLVTRTVRNLREYFEGVRSEIEKVVWPTREETRRLATIVLIVLIISAIVLGLISGLFTEVFRIGLTNPVVLIVFMVAGGALLYFIGRYFSRSQESRY